MFHISERDKKELMTVSYIMDRRIPVARHIYDPLASRSDLDVSL
jgi:hypothetical protein